MQDAIVHHGFYGCMNISLCMRMEIGNKKFQWYIRRCNFCLVHGAQLPEGVVDDISDKQAREIWVLGISYLPAAYVRNFSRRQTGYIFHTELNEGDADKALYGKCPELVRVQNSL